ncbi:Uncharacterized protein ABC855_g1785 [[Candida] zeylanoides]
MSSMSVHSLIDRDDRQGGQEGAQPSAPQRSAPAQPRPQPSQSSTGASDASAQGNEGLLALLGPNITSFPYSEQAYVESVKLRAEQERTKQEYYRHETAARNLAILQTALRAQIPSHMIPMMCVGSDPLQQQPSTRPPSVDIRRGSMGQPDVYNASPVPPMQYRFGAGSGTAGPPGGSGLAPTMGSSARPQSPAKIGAAAVANLATPTTPFRSKRHQRHYSMPTESVTRSPGRSVDLNRISEHSARHKSPSLQPAAPASALSTPQGATSQIYVKPAPAQPLTKQTRQGHQPSQESMTSLQHIIQFHHWKPEFPGQQQPSQHQQQQQPHPPQPHKRHKSHSDNMSVDLSTATPAIRVDEADVSMDTEDKEGREGKAYPDILTSEGR